MRDVLPQQKQLRDQILQIIRDTYRANGFAEIETPAVEPLTRLASDQGGENEKMIFEIMRRGLPKDEPVIAKDAADLGLRYDLTVPLSRFYATNAAHLPRVFRALQTGSVWRAERPQKGRFRQFRQCDIDVIGDGSITAEVDLLVTTLQAFTALGMQNDIEVLINDRRILTDLLNSVGVAPDAHGETLVVLDKVDKIGEAGASAELVKKGLVTEAQAATLLSNTAHLRTQAEASDLVLAGDSVALPDGTTISLQELPQIIASVKELEPAARVTFDPTLVRGMGYYTGPIFEVKHRQRDFSVAGGGRYDHVIGKWLGRDVPACGFSIGFERIADLVELPASETPRVALFHRPGADPVALFRLRKELREAGFEVGLVVPPRRLSAQFFESLEAEGYTHSVDGRRTDASLEDLRALDSADDQGSPGQA